MEDGKKEGSIKIDYEKRTNILDEFFSYSKDINKKKEWDNSKTFREK